MSSSPVLTPPVESLELTRPGLLELFEQVGDPRARRGVRHRFAGLLAVGLAAVLAGARSFTAIGEWVADAEAGVLVKLGIAAGRRPCEATIRRAFARLDADRLDAVLGAWMRARVGVAGGRRVIAIDGKTTPPRQGKKSVEVVYVITSMPSADASPTQIATWVQGHWGTREQAPLRSVTSSSTKTLHRPD